MEIFFVQSGNVTIHTLYYYIGEWRCNFKNSLVQIGIEQNSSFLPISVSTDMFPNDADTIWYKKYLPSKWIWIFLPNSYLWCQIKIQTKYQWYNANWQGFCTLPVNYRRKSRKFNYKVMNSKSAPGKNLIVVLSSASRGITIPKWYIDSST